MSSLPPPDTEFPNDTSVVDWMNGLRERYSSPDPGKSTGHRSRMKTLKVVTIRRFKANRSPEHEYLVAKVLDPDLGQPQFLRIERSPQRHHLPTNDTAEKSPHIIPFSSNISLSSDSAPSLGVFKKLPADDYVTKVRDWPAVDKCIDYLKCEHSPMILLDLATVAKLVHDHSDKYELFTRQCYWYSDAIIGVLVQHFPQIIVMDRSNLEETEIFDRLSGTYMRVSVHSRRMPLIREIHDIFVKYNLELQSSVNPVIIGIFLLTNRYHV